MNEPTFDSFSLSPEILEALRLLHYDAPTPVQQQAIPAILDGRDVMVKSKTGSGKTAAFAIPLCEKVIWEENMPQALVLEPTRELSVQVKDEIFHIGRKKRLKIPAVFGGFPIDKQILTLKQKSHIVVGTPGRVLDLIDRGSLCFDKLKFLILDEADLLLNMGFTDQITEILARLPKNRTTMLFSATMDEKVSTLASLSMKDPLFLSVESQTETAEEIIQLAYRVENEDKFDCLTDVLISENPQSAMIFCGTREMVGVLYQKLLRLGIRCGMLHGLIDQKERLRTIEGFRDEKFKYLIATDIAARGIDLEQVSHVINYDFPSCLEDYVHRIGRTGRNGRTGTSITFINQSEERQLERLKEFTRADIQFPPRPDKAAVKQMKNAFYDSQKPPAKQKARKTAALNSDIMRLIIGGGRRSKMRAGDIVGALCSLPCLTMDDIGIIDIRESLTYVEIRNHKGAEALQLLEKTPIKGKLRNVKKDSRPMR